MSEDLVLRGAVPGDASELAHLHVAAWRWAYRGLVDAGYLASLDPAARTSVWAERLATGGSTVVAERDGGIVGFVSYGRPRDADAPASGCEVYAIYLDEAHQGTGVGRALMERALADLAASGCTEATLWVLETNALARRFYERAGWRTDGATQQEVIGGEPLLEVRYRRPVP